MAHPNHPPALPRASMQRLITRLLVLAMSLLLPAAGLASLVTFGFAASATAAELTLLGPVQCERTKGRPDVYTYQFASLAEQNGYVSGTLLIWNGDPDRQHQVTSAVVWVNGEKVAQPAMFNPDMDVLQIPLSRLKAKNNHLKVEVRGKPGTYLTLQVAEVGDQGPDFSGPQQYPFVCRTEQSGLGQPLVDNYEGLGVPVYVDNSQPPQIVGYGKDCGIVTQVDYFYRSTDPASNALKPITRFAPHPSDLAYTTTNEGRSVPFIVRLERGTINRFIYGIAILEPWGHNGAPITAYNNKLLFQLDGGVAIGHDQGRLNRNSLLNHQALARGYAVAYSTGNRTGVHYNLQLSGETALMVKQHFVHRFGAPDFTMGLGGSGGAIQQYIFAQNHPGLLDGIIPQRSYSDMITQTIYVGDCMLMEFYFDVIAPMQGDRSFGGFAVNPATADVTYIGSTANRTLLQGMSTSDTQPHPIYTPMTGGQLGSTECVNGWLGLTPLVMNPLFTGVDDLDQFPDQVVTDVKWTHWDDLRNIYGIDAEGYAPSTWDNQGVQYGLQALRDGTITLAQFLDINAKIGGWKKPADMVVEGFPFSMWNTIQHLVGPAPNPADFDPWSIRNSTFNPYGIAPRTIGDIEAMRAAYTSGMVYIGQLDIPAIDIRDYLDPVLDMHHAQQSFATRRRIIDHQQSAANQLIWMKDPASGFDITTAAIEMMDHWLTNIGNNPNLSVAANKPAAAQDRCVTANETTHQGPNVWNGILDTLDPGACTQAFPLFSTSRIIAGGDIKGDIFKCHLIPVQSAINQGFYGDLPIATTTRQHLEAIFPDGVCDYSQGDLGRPAEQQQPKQKHKGKKK